MRSNPFLFFLALVLIVSVFQPHGAFAQGYTLDEDLIYRINFGSADDVRVLLEKGANPNARTKQNETALAIAMERGDAESAAIAEALIDKGADVEAVDKNGNTPLINALRLHQDKTALALIAKGANYHVRTPDGIAMVDYAKMNGDVEAQKTIQALLDKETVYQQSMRTPERFKQIAQIYTMNSCRYQYWNYYLASRQSPDKDMDTKKKIAAIKSDLYQQITQIQKYYTANSLMALHNVASKAVQQIYDSLDAMISNSNRNEKGVGTDADEEARCTKIVAGLPMDFVPVPLDITLEPAAPAAAPTSATSPTLTSTHH